MVRNKCKWALPLMGLFILSVLMYISLSTCLCSDLLEYKLLTHTQIEFNKPTNERTHTLNDLPFLWIHSRANTHNKQMQI